MAGLLLQTSTKLFSSVATGDDTKDDSGVNYLNVFSDYQNAAHGEGKTVESLLVKDTQSPLLTLVKH